MNVLSIVPFHNSVVSVAYEWIIFHLESSISAVNVVNDKNNFSGYLGSHYVVNDEIINNVALDISVISVVKNHHFWTRTLENVSLM